jgi:hypothetical protein
MRYFATSLVFAWFTVSAARPLAASSMAPVDPSGGHRPAAVAPADQTEEQKAYGVLEETPNQRRIRLGQTIVASYPAPDYGELLETTNHRRVRLGIPAPETDAYGVTQETPNQRAERLANQTALKR